MSRRALWSGARLSLHCRSDPPDESGGSYESECEPGGLYGAEKPADRYGQNALTLRTNHIAIAMPTLLLVPTTRPIVAPIAGFIVPWIVV